MKLTQVFAAFTVLAVASAPLLGAAPGSALVAVVAPQDAKPISYARVNGAGAKVVNMQDANGSAIHRPAKGDLLAVHRDTGRWLEVESPGGFAVWVFGRYLTATGEADVFRVNGDGVNLRPSPSRGVSNFPLSQQLYTGDRVRLVERADTSLPLAQDWVRIWSPPGVRGWIQKSSTSALAPSEDGEALWKKALAALPPAPERAERAKSGGASGSKAAKTTEASGPKQDAAAVQAAAERFDAALATAGERLEAEREKDTPNWAAVRALYAEAERAATDGADLAQVRAGLQALGALEETTRLRAQLEAERVRREEAARREQERVWAEAREKDPLGGVFLVRGSVERVVEGEGDEATKRYFIKFGTGVVAEVVCVSGRYDLDLFVGYQIGVRGTELASAAEGTTRLIEVSRLEVIARRP